MAVGALGAYQAELAVSITGVAGPGGGTSAKPVGLVHFATAFRGRAVLAHAELFGEVGRAAVRLQAVKTALNLLRARLD